jgi:hypothetical protein
MSHLLRSKLDRQTQAAGYVLEIDKSFAGRIFSPEWGFAGGPEIVDRLTPDPWAHRHVDPSCAVYAMSSFKCGAGMSRAFYDWLHTSIADAKQRKNVTVISYDYNRQIIHRMEFDRVGIGEIVFPDLDSSRGRDGAFFTVKIAPEAARVQAGGEWADLKWNGKGPPPITRKEWRRSDFRLSITGLEAACKYVHRIGFLRCDCFGRIPAASDIHSGLERVGVSYSAPILTFNKAAVTNHDAFAAWLEAGQLELHAKTEKSGYIEFLDPSLQPYFRVDLRNWGIVRASERKDGLCEVETYCDGMVFSYTGHASVG